jgi:hypothetical protein
MEPMSEQFARRWLLDPATEPLPPPDRDLKGRVAPERAARKEPESPFDIIGGYDAFIVVTHVDKAIASALLPAQLELGYVPDTPAGKHPVMYSFGRHRNVHPRFFGLFDYDYEEALIGLPHVMFRRSNGTLSGPFFHMTAVRLNNRFATNIGVALGFPKEMATITMSPTGYSIRMSPSQPEVMRGEMRASGPPFNETFPNFASVSPMMLQRVISQTPSGNFVVTPFHIDTATALMMPARAEIRIFDDSLAGMPGGTYSFNGIDTTAFGGGYLSVHNWQMSPSLPIFP